MPLGAPLCLDSPPLRNAACGRALGLCPGRTHATPAVTARKLHQHRSSSLAQLPDFPWGDAHTVKNQALALNRSGPSACEQQGLCQPGWEAAVLVLRGAGAGATGG